MLHNTEEKELRLPKDRMVMLKVKIFFVFTGLVLLFLPKVVKAVKTFSRDSEHRGILDLRPYQIYPENRIGNGIYLDKKLLDTHPQRAILNITSIKNTESYVYLFRDQNGVFGLGIVKNEADGDARFWKVDPEFYQYTNSSFGIQRVFRIYQEKIVPLLTNIRTGSGVVTSANHAILYHITDSKDITRTTSSGQEITQRVYNFRLHLINRNFKKIQSLFNLQVQDVSYRLKLKWVNEYSVSYKLSNGKEETVDLRKHAPTLF
jgi:hypothetical protein